MTPLRMRRIAILAELHSLEQPQWRCAELMGLKPSGVSLLATSIGLKFSKTWMNRHAKGAVNRVRVESMAALYRAGYTLEQIGTQFGITRERVRQLLAKHKGMDRNSGGQSVAAERGRKQRASRLDARALAKYGCTFAQWQAVRDYGRGLVSSGRGKYQAPLAAFRTQRSNAGRRSIGWELTFWQWWCIWQASGHWDERGRGDGYVMCRTGDEGPYAVGNVFIASAAQNSYDAQVKRHGLTGELPMGVHLSAPGRYVAIRRSRSLGTYSTPEAAHAAYLLGKPTNETTRVRSGLPSGVRHSGRRFNAYHYVGRKQVHIGTFDTVDEAVAARAAALSPLAVAA